MSNVWYSLILTVYRSTIIMREVMSLGIKETGYTDKRYSTPVTANYSLFECPVCLTKVELITYVGRKRLTCLSCRGTQNVKHGQSGTKPYYVWQSMKQRCNNPKNKKYHIYGGKGISVDTSWDTFDGFWTDMGSGYKEGLTIDREDANKNYCKENCRWISLSQNSSETSKRRPVIQYRVAYKPNKHLVYMQEFESAQRAAEELSLTPTHITGVCKGQRKTHGGFVWQYK